MRNTASLLGAGGRCKVEERSGRWEMAREGGRIKEVVGGHAQYNDALGEGGGASAKDEVGGGR